MLGDTQVTLPSYEATLGVTAKRITDRFTMMWIGPAAFVMTRRMLSGITRRAEATADTRKEAT